MAEADYYYALFFGEDGLVYCPAAGQVREEVRHKRADRLAEAESGEVSDEEGWRRKERHEQEAKARGPTTRETAKPANGMHQRRAGVLASSTATSRTYGRGSGCVIDESYDPVVNPDRELFLNHSFVAFTEFGRRHGNTLIAAAG